MISRWGIEAENSVDAAMSPAAKNHRHVMTSLFRPIAAAMVAAALLSGCASHSLEAADREQKAADDLRRGGAGSTTAARNAQERADRNRQDAQCGDLLTCAFEVVGQLLLGALTGGDSARK